MINTVKALKYCPYISEKPVGFFIANRRHISNPEKSSCFVRRIGTGGSENGWRDFIVCLDDEFAARGVPYLRVSSLSEPPLPSEAARYAELYEAYAGGKEIALPLKNRALSMTLAPALSAVVDELCKARGTVSETVLRNFIVKLLRFAEVRLTPLLNASDLFPKIVFAGEIKLQEYLVLYFCARMGCDVLYISSSGDVDFGRGLSALELLSGSAECVPPPPPLLQTVGKEQSGSPTRRPEMSVSISSGRTSIQSSAAVSSSENSAAKAVQSSSPIVISASAVRRPDRAESAPTTQNAVPSRPQGTPQSCPPSAPVRAAVPQRNSVKRELSYEELAALSVSVVMITLQDSFGKTVGSGSGVVISPKGFILTNLHVAAHGSRYMVRFENDSVEYGTSGIVKYNQRLDLAVIKVDRRCVPIQPYLDGKLARGQRVVAIGSPLGLFNTVSDGIISAFRSRENGAKMIQFTAPISSGSSGGAVLDMYGRLIGISTSGFDEAQNINLAVEISEVYAFANNFFTA